MPTPRTPALALVSGADNRFVLVDARMAELPDDRAAYARELCSHPGADGRPWDGVLILGCADSGAAHARLEIRNRDGSRPEACGNGLRCAAWYLLREGIVPGDRVRLETDAGTREVLLVERAENGRSALLLGSMGPLAWREPDPPVQLEPGERACLAFDLGNPHLILRVADERACDVARRGADLQTHPAFPRGVNVGFLATRDGAHHLRVFERGVGETMACGTNTAAAAAYLMLREGAHSRLDLHLPGGALRVERADGELRLLGPASVLAPQEVRER